MFCINCFHKKTNVTNSRGHKKAPSIWRRRTCPECGFAFTTYESFALDELLLIETSNVGKPYNRGKLLASLIDSLRPTGDDLSQAYWLVLTVEEKLLDKQRRTSSWQKVNSEALARIVYDTLLAYNTVAGYTYGAAHGLISMGQKRKRGRPSIS
jgi:transcriptional repressor NrdR